ncbi:OLC1v1027450C1 [Oldenlandia corymbosa var. corymbosa]|uniref:OLC1v1027450C1 n=1 Tax=Oldenlandia corymbosa var. corymbosa TaxID=529605 RepID=A0AAV1CA37_OLDCO|nr:OLC1v1027450C1 [Oldenlandia corymbosa var. corymbosa]
MAVVKPEMKSYVWLQTAGGSIQQVEEEVAMFCPMICREVLQGKGSSKNYAISLPHQVSAASLGLILDYCRFHQVPGRSNKERKTYDEKLAKSSIKTLCELTSAADSLQLRPLVDLTSRALARIIEGKSPEEIRETFNLPDDLTEEEKLEPLRNWGDDPHIRLLNRLYARKRKELEERKRLKNVEVEEEHRTDERSVDDLLSFINGGDRESKGVKVPKNKKKNRRRKDRPKNSSSDNVNGNSDKEANHHPSGCLPGDTDKSFPSKNLLFQDKIEFDDGDMDDELDPAMKEELDREVADFARRLNSVWPERMQEFLSMGQERRPVPVSLKGDGSVKNSSGTNLIHFTPQPIYDCKDPPGIVENWYEHKDRQGKPIVKGYSFGENLGCLKENMRSGCPDAFLVSSDETFQNVWYWKNEADYSSQDNVRTEKPALFTEQSETWRRKNRWEGDF